MRTIINEIKLKSLSGNTIKIIAIIAMIIDHVGWAFVDTDSVPAMIMHTIGKLTGPIMCYYIAEGNHFTRNRKKYVDRLALFVLISHIPYNLFFNYGREITLLPTSVIFTLLCGLLALIVYERVDRKLLKWFLIISLVGITFWSDWSLWGVIFVLCFGIFYGNKQKQWTAYLILNCIKVAIIFYGVGWNYYRLVPVVISPLLVVAILNLYNGSKGGNRYTRWAFYVIYPLQFLLIGGVWLLIYL
jgi:hypothetical protein